MLIYLFNFIYFCTYKASMCSKRYKLITFNYYKITFNLKRHLFQLHIEQHIYKNLAGERLHKYRDLKPSPHAQQVLCVQTLLEFML